MNKDENTGKKEIIFHAIAEGKEWDDVYDLLEKHFQEKAVNSVRDYYRNGGTFFAPTLNGTIKAIRGNGE